MAMPCRIVHDAEEGIEYGHLHIQSKPEVTLRRVLTWGTCALLLLSILLPWLLAAGPQRIADFVHREAVYASIVDRIEAKSSTETEFAMALFRFVQDHIFVFPGQSLDQFNLSSPPLEYLKLQSGWCDQQGGLLITLAQRKGIDGKLLILEDERGTPIHVLSVLRIDDEQRILDPYYGLLFLSPEGQLAPEQKVLKVDYHDHPYVSPQYEGAMLFGSKGTKDELSGILALLGDPGGITSQELQLDGLRKGVSRFVFLYHALFGDVFLHTLQAVYFSMQQIEDYERARLLQLAGRLDEAVKAYTDLLEHEADTDRQLSGMIYSASRPRGAKLYPAVVRFSLAQTQWSRGSYRQASQAFENLIEHYPDSGWADVARYFLGDMYDRMGDTARARGQWLSQPDNPSLPTFERLYATRLDSGGSSNQK